MAAPKAFDWTNGHVQRETGTDSLHGIFFVTFADYNCNWRLSFNFPVHIYRALSEATRDQCRSYSQNLFVQMLALARLAEEENAVQICLEESLRTYIENLYRGFVYVQMARGNQKWLVPATVQKNVLEEN